MSFDIIAISEAWTSSETRHYVLPEYTLFYTYRAFSRGDGVALYVKNCNWFCQGEQIFLLAVYTVVLRLPYYSMKNLKMSHINFE